MNKLRALPVQREVSGTALAERTVTFVSESMLLVRLAFLLNLNSGFRGPGVFSREFQASTAGEDDLQVKGASGARMQLR
jgi:hypothetical protein